MESPIFVYFSTRNTYLIELINVLRVLKVLVDVFVGGGGGGGVITKNAFFIDTTIFSVKVFKICPLFLPIFQFVDANLLGVF
jgi:hypothetical protein